MWCPINLIHFLNLCYFVLYNLIKMVGRIIFSLLLCATIFALFNLASGQSDYAFFQIKL